MFIECIIDIDHGRGVCEVLLQFQGYNSVLEIRRAGLIVETRARRFRFF